MIVTLNLSQGVFNNGMLEFKENRDQFEFALVVITVVCTGLFLLIFEIFKTSLLNMFEMPLVMVYIMALYFLFVPAYQFWSGRQRYEYKYKALSIVTVCIGLFSLLLGVLFVLNVSSGKEAIARVLEVVSEYFSKVFSSQTNSLLDKEKHNAPVLTLKIKNRHNRLFFQDNRCVKMENEINIIHKAIYIDNPFIVDALAILEANEHTIYDPPAVFDSNKSEILLSTENKLKEIYEVFPNEGKVVLGYSYLVSWNYVTWLDFPRPIDEELIPLFKKWIRKFPENKLELMEYYSFILFEKWLYMDSLDNISEANKIYYEIKAIADELSKDYADNQVTQMLSMGIVRKL